MTDHSWLFDFAVLLLIFYWIKFQIATVPLKYQFYKRTILAVQYYTFHNSTIISAMKDKIYYWKSTQKIRKNEEKFSSFLARRVKPSRENFLREYLWRIAVRTVFLFHKSRLNQSIWWRLKYFASSIVLIELF